MNFRRVAVLLAVALCGLPLPERAIAAGVNLTLCVATSTDDTTSCASGGSTSGGTGGGTGGGSGGGGGGGGGIILPSIPTPTVTFEGVAYPGSMVTLLRNGAVAASVPAGPDARFTIAVSNLAVGLYTFGIYAVDSAGTRSSLQSFTITVGSGVNTGVGGIFIPPTLTLDKTVVKQGAPLTLLGSAAPGSNISVAIHSDTQLLLRATTTSQGIWRTVLDTTPLERGDHNAQAQAALPESISAYTDMAHFTVGDNDVAAKPQKCGRADMNADCRVNIVDFSIMAYWYKRTLSEAAKNFIDLNHDGKITIIDFSILAFNWTG